VTPKPVVPRALANRDVDDAISYYLEEGSPRTALRFIDALENAYSHIASSPAAGSPRYAQELGIPQLRCWPLDAFPYLVFYVERPDHVDVWRVLHGRRDIPAWLQEPDSHPHPA